jgi:hypothetical protein
LGSTIPHLASDGHAGCALLDVEEDEEAGDEGPGSTGLAERHEAF